MKRTFIYALAAIPASGGQRASCFLLAYILTVLTILPLGCATQSSTYPTLKKINIRVSWEMTRFRNVATWGRLTLGERERGNAAYSAYKSAFDEALQAANNNSDAPAPENVKTLANEAIRVLSTMPKMY